MRIPVLALSSTGRRVVVNAILYRAWCVVLFVGGGLFLLAGVLGCSDTESSDSPEEAAANNEEPSLAVAAVEVYPRTLTHRISASNPVEALRTVRPATPVTGTMRRVYVEEGNRVRAGDLLAEMDVREQRAELKRAEARLEQELAAYERTRQLRDRDFSSAQEYESQKAERDVAASEVELWETRVELGQIRASTDAVVTERNVEPGEAVSSNDALFALADVSTLVVRVGVSERHIPHMEQGQSVDVHLDAYPDTSFGGSVRRIFPHADDDRRVRVEIALDSDAHTHARPGFLARLQLSVDERTNVHAVPSEALLGSGNDPAVFVITDGELERRSVTTGIDRGGWTEIREGLHAGERVVASNPAALQPGTRVRISNLIAHPSDPDDVPGAVGDTTAASAE